MSSDSRNRAPTTASLPQEVSSSVAVAASASSVSTSAAPALSGLGQVSDSAAIPTNAQGAVNTVLRVADLQAASGESASSSVNLHFRIGEASLSVRVELQAGTVHTQFSTSSSELRNAIASEWQSASGSLTTKAVHFAEPTYSSSGNNSQSDSGTRWSDGNAQQQRQASPEDYAAATGYSPSSSDEIEPEAAVSAAAPAPSLLSNRFQTFA